MAKLETIAHIEFTTPRSIEQQEWDFDPRFSAGEQVDIFIKEMLPEKAPVGRYKVVKTPREAGSVIIHRGDERNQYFVRNYQLALVQKYGNL